MVVCPTTGLRIKHDDAERRRRRAVGRQRSDKPEAILGWIIDNRYRLKSVIGQGGMSAIYEAEELTDGGRVALKVLHPSLSDDREATARLRREAEVVSAINHKNICNIYHTGRAADGSPYLVMERLFGENMAERIRSLGPRPFTELAPLICQVLEALQAAHDKNILHRDLKPENVFVEQPDGKTLRAKLLDFGISKAMGTDFMHQQRLTHTGMVMGTPYYMAPEQARGDSGLDQRVDLWAVGVMLYEGLSGTRPFVATNYNALLVKILTSRPIPIRDVMPNLNGDIVNIVDKALSKEPGDRFQSAHAFRDAINSVLVTMTPDDGPTVMQMPAWTAEVPSREETATRAEPAVRWPLEDDELPPSENDSPGSQDTEVITRADLAALAAHERARSSQDSAVVGLPDIPEEDATLQKPPTGTASPSSAQDTEFIRRDDHTALREMVFVNATRPAKQPSPAVPQPASPPQPVESLAKQPHPAQPPAKRPAPPRRNRPRKALSVRPGALKAPFSQRRPPGESALPQHPSSPSVVAVRPQQSNEPYQVSASFVAAPPPPPPPPPGPGMPSAAAAAAAAASPQSPAPVTTVGARLPAEDLVALFSDANEDDEEAKTTLYNVEEARARLLARRQQRAETDKKGGGGQSE